MARFDTTRDDLIRSLHMSLMVTPKLERTPLVGKIEDAYAICQTISDDPETDRRVLVEIAIAESHLRRARIIAENGAAARRLIREATRS